MSFVILGKNAMVYMYILGLLNKDLCDKEVKKELFVL